MAETPPLYAQRLDALARMVRSLDRYEPSADELELANGVLALLARVDDLERANERLRTPPTDDDLLVIKSRSLNAVAESLIAIPDERIRKGVMRAHGWLSAGANRDLHNVTVEMVDALAHDVIEFAGEIVKLVRADAEAFADAVLEELDATEESPCQATFRIAETMAACRLTRDHEGPHRCVIDCAEFSWNV